MNCLLFLFVKKKNQKKIVISGWLCVHETIWQLNPYPFPYDFLLLCFRDFIQTQRHHMNLCPRQCQKYFNGGCPLRTAHKILELTVEKKHKEKYKEKKHKEKCKEKKWNKRKERKCGAFHFSLFSRFLSFFFFPLPLACFLGISTERTVRLIFLIWQFTPMNSRIKKKIVFSTTPNSLFFCLRWQRV